MTRLTHRLFLRALGAAAIGVVLAACGKQLSRWPRLRPRPSRPKRHPHLRPPRQRFYAVGTDAAYAPFELQNEKGEIVGFSIDLMNALSRPRPASR